MILCLQTDGQIREIHFSLMDVQHDERGALFASSKVCPNASS
jgi:hypothetical protein